jgi:Zn-finger nucleic acid-binding protein
MRAKARSEAEISFELKYCERCGGLWLRPTGGEQIYCRVCAGAMAELPPASTEIRERRMRPRERHGVKSDIEAYAWAGAELDAAGGLR